MKHMNGHVCLLRAQTAKERHPKDQGSMQILHSACQGI